MDQQQHDERYSARGVSAGKHEVHEAIGTQDKGLFPGAFCKIIPDLLSTDPEHCLLMHADGAGTKSSLAYLAWKESGDASIWRGIAQDSLVMNLDDCACVGALGPYLVSNTIGRNAKRIPGNVIAAIIEGYQGVCDALAKEGVSCIMTGGETADVGDLVRTAIVDSTITARMARKDVINAANMSPGDIIVSISSTGQARWEDKANSGMGSNGLTSARHDALGSDYRARYPETYAPEVDASLIYAGSRSLDDALPGDDSFTVGSALLSPTRTYVPFIAALLKEIPASEIKGIIHSSGGGQAKIGKFGMNPNGKGNRYVKDNPFPVPPLFRYLQEQSGCSWAEAYTVWNMGSRLDVVIPERHVDTVLSVSQDCRLDARRSGFIEEADGNENEVIIDGEGGRHSYQP